MDTITLLQTHMPDKYQLISKGKVNCVLQFVFTKYSTNKFYIAVLHEGKLLPMAGDVIIDISTFLDMTKMTPK